MTSRLITRGRGLFEGSLKFFKGRLIRLGCLNQKPELFHEHLPCLGLRLRCSELVFSSETGAALGDNVAIISNLGDA